MAPSSPDLGIRLGSSLHLLDWSCSIEPYVIRRITQLGSLVFLAGISLLYPLIESLDGFDSPVPASDLEIQLIALLTFVGIMFVLGHLVASLAICVLLLVLRYLRSRVSVTVRMREFAFLPLLTASPPVPLRI